MGSIKFWAFSFALMTGASCLENCMLIINDRIDKSLEAANRWNREEGHTYLEKRSGELAQIKFEGMTVLGLDSARRTGECVLESAPGLRTFRLHVGLGFLQFFFKRLTLDKETFAASFRVDKNSIYLSYTMKKASPEHCSVSVHDLKIEQAEDITLYASNLKYWGQSITDLFNRDIVPEMNKHLERDKSIVEAFLEKRYCSTFIQLHQENNFFPFILRQLIKSAFP